MLTVHNIHSTGKCPTCHCLSQEHVILGYFAWIHCLLGRKITLYKLSLLDNKQLFGERAGFLVKHRKEFGLRARQTWIQVQMTIQSFSMSVTLFSGLSLLFFKTEIMIPSLGDVERIQ